MFTTIFGRRDRESSEILPEDVFLDARNVNYLDTDRMQGHLEVPLPERTSTLFVLTVCVMLTFFAYKTYAVTITKGAVYKEVAKRNSSDTEPIFANRGAILDRNGVPLAWNEPKGSTSLISDIPARKYIDDQGFAHVLGYVSYPQKDAKGNLLKDHEEYLGKDGAERQYQSLLQGVNGRVISQKSALGIDAVSSAVIDPPIDGENIRLTIDADVQTVLHKAIESLAAKAHFVAGSGVIMDVHTGEILALTSYPEYSSEIMSNATGSRTEVIGKWVNDDRHIFMNRPVNGLFVPGSTVKPFIAYAALAENIISPFQNIFSSGQLVIKNKYGGPDTIFRDWKAHGYVDMREAIAQSSDEYFYQVGGGFESQKGLGIRKINEYMTKFGFGTTTGIDLPGEVYGTIPSPEWKQEVFGKDWLLGDTYHTSIGQFGTQVTPLELIRANAAIANGGFFVVPHIFASGSSSSTDIQLDQEHLKVIREGMRRGAISGTGKALNIGGVTSATKSGTAELGVDRKLVNSWIGGYFPYEHPRYAFVVTMEKASRDNKFGATLAMRDVLTYLRDNTNYIYASGTPYIQKPKSVPVIVQSSSTDATSSPSGIQ